ncbi:MAG: DNA-processing protein DprA, partial [Caldilineae bacterium]
MPTQPVQAPVIFLDKPRRGRYPVFRATLPAVPRRAHLYILPTLIMLRYWLAFNMVPGIGARRLQKLIELFGDVKAAWEAPADELALAGLDTRSLNNLLEMRQKLDLDAVEDGLKRHGITAITWGDERYPANLARVATCPPVLYIKGELLPEDEWAVAIVGTRKDTAYGRECARRLSQDLAQAGVTIVSGLARGIDAVAHHAALEAGGRTLAVLGNGLDRVYPPEHRGLAQRILERGALISEYAPGVRPEARNFPARNRIISGLSLAVV